MAEEKRPPTLKELLVKESGKPKSPEEILDTFKRCSRRGVSIIIGSLDDISILNKVDFSGMDLKKLRDYMNNGAEVCVRKGRPKDSAINYRTLFNYFNGRIPERYNPRNP